MSDKKNKLKTCKCEATTNPCFWWDPKKIEFPKCTHKASVKIDGLNLCVKHAGTLAIIKLLAIGDAERLPGINKYSPVCLKFGDQWGKKVNVK